MIVSIIDKIPIPSSSTLMLLLLGKEPNLMVVITMAIKNNTTHNAGSRADNK